MYKTRTRLYLAATAVPVALALGLGACGDDSSTGNPPIEDVVTTIRVTPSNSTLQVGDTVRLSARAFNQFGAAMDGVTFLWLSVDNGIASVDDSGLVTAEGAGSTVISARSGTVSGGAAVEVLLATGGLAIKTQTLPTRPVGLAYSVSLEAVGGEGTRTWTLESGTLPAGLTLDGSGLISGTPTTGGDFSFRVKVTDDSGSAEADLTLTVSAASGTVDLGNIYMGSAYVGVPFSFVPSLSGGDGTYAFTISEGVLPAGLSLDPLTGEISGTPTQAQVEFFRLRVESGGTSSRRSLSLAVSGRPPGEFNMTIFNVANDPPSERILDFLSQVVARYEEILTTDLPGGAFPIGSELPSCNSRGSLMEGAWVDDMTILVNIGPIDGPSNVIGFAAPCELVENNEAGQPVTTFGHLTLDDADLDNLSDKQLFGLIWHEIGHIVGIGSLWRSGQPPGFEVLEGAGAVQRYIGANAVREFNQLGGSGDFIVVQPSVAGHWDETEYDHELMTPFIEGPDVDSPISAFTIGSFQDLSYGADPSKADPYEFPAQAPAAVQGRDEDVIDLTGDILWEPMRFMRMDGSVTWVFPAALLDRGGE